MKPDDLFSAPIPGQSLTQDPSSRGPWEMPPKYNVVSSALDSLYKNLTSPEKLRSLATLTEDSAGFSLDGLASTIIEEGITEGHWTPDVAILLVEPLIILLVDLCCLVGNKPKFSNDNGLEDRTGYEEYVSSVVDSVPAPVESPVEPTTDPVTPPPMTPTAPQVNQAPQLPQSPLVGGM